MSLEMINPIHSGIGRSRNYRRNASFCQAITNKSEDKYQKIDLEVGLYAGGSIGGSGGAKGGLGIYGSAAYQQSKTELSSTTHEETTLDATNKLSLKTGRDASLTGTVATADSIKADIGRNLSLKSEQDIDRYRQQQLGGQIEGRYAFGNDSGVSGSLNYSQTKSDYKSVQEQTGLNAGKGGFDITVGKHTQLDGATIASTATPDKNKLSTDTLGHTDLNNEASYSALSANISFGGGGNGGGSGGSSGLGSPIPTTILPGLGAPTSDSKSSTTKSAIAAGTITIKQDQQTGTDSTNNLSRDTANANQKLDRIFDANKVAEQQEMGRVLGEVGNRAIGDLSQKLNLKDGSPEKIALHAALGALQAGAAGGNALAGAAAAGGMEWLNTKVADYLVKQPSLQPTGNKDEDIKRESQRKVIQQWAALIGGATIGGAIGGNGTAALAGGATALDAERFNRQLHQSERDFAKQNAKRFAQHYEEKTGQKIDDVRAEQILLGDGYRMVDASANKGPGVAGPAGDAIARSFLAQNAGNLFKATAAEYNNPGKLGGPLTPEQAALPAAKGNPAAAAGVVAIIASGGLAAAYAPQLIAAGTATAQFGVDAWTAYKAASAAYSMGTALGTGAVVGGAGYTGGAVVGAFNALRYGANFTDTFNQNFSYPGLAAATTIGGLGGMYGTAMFGWAGVANSLGNITTLPGFIIRANSFALGKAAGGAVQAAVKSSNNK